MQLEINECSDKDGQESLSLYEPAVKEWIKSEFFPAVHTNDYNSLVAGKPHVWGESLLNTHDTRYLVPIINNSNNNNNSNSTKRGFMQEL